MSVTGEPDGHPVRVGVSLIDIGTGVWAALAIVAALHEGQGRTTRPLALRDGALARPLPARRRPGGRRPGRAPRHGVPADRPVPGVRDGRRRADDRGGERPPLREGLPGGGRSRACRRRALHHESAPHRQPRAADPAAAGADLDRDDRRAARRTPRRRRAGLAGERPRGRRRGGADCARPGSCNSSAAASSCRRRSRPTASAFGTGPSRRCSASTAARSSSRPATARPRSTSSSRQASSG